MKSMTNDSRIWVAGHTGLVGKAIVNALQQAGYTNLVLRTHSELDLLKQDTVEQFVHDQKIEFAFIAAAKVGGILFNQQYQADFLYENLAIANNVMHAAHKFNVEKLLYLGSSCIYPKHAPQPIKEEYLLSGPLEPTNEGYALAKIAGLKLCEKYHLQYGRRFIAAMPTNLYGPGDNFHPDHSHVIPGLMRRFHQAKVEQAKEVVVWGSGTPRREFLYVEDLAQGLLQLMHNYEESTPINIGTGLDISIGELAQLMKEVTGYAGEIRFDATKPDGTPRKVLDVSKIKKLGWQARMELGEGLRRTYQWWSSQKALDRN